MDPLGRERVLDIGEVLPMPVVLDQGFAPRAGELWWDDNAEVLEEAQEVPTPTGGDSGRAER